MLSRPATPRFAAPVNVHRAERYIGIHTPGLSIDAFMLVFATCSMTSLLACARTCRSLRTIVAVEMRMRAFALFRVFFEDRVRHFTGLLRLHNAVVSGSVALAFFSSPVSWEPGDLDVYVGYSAYPSFIIDLERHFPVTLEADMRSRRPSRYAGIKGVRRYRTISGKRIEVIRSASPNPVSPLLYFWSSAVVNFITPHGAVCGYPKHTLAEQGFLRDVRPSRKVVSARAKYEARGFTFMEVGSWRSPDWVEQDGHRIFTDGDVLVVDFQRARPPGLLVLPIERARIAWVLKSARIHALFPDALYGRHEVPSTRSASVDRSQQVAFRGSLPPSVEYSVYVDAGYNASSE